VAIGMVGIKTAVLLAALTGVIVDMIVEVAVSKMVADVIVVAAHKGVRVMIGNLLSAYDTLRIMYKSKILNA